MNILGLLRERLLFMKSPGAAQAAINVLLSALLMLLRVRLIQGIALIKINVSIVAAVIGLVLLRRLNG
jgi:riboflavin transporter FmnP